MAVKEAVAEEELAVVTRWRKMRGREGEGTGGGDSIKRGGERARRGKRKSEGRARRRSWSNGKGRRGMTRTRIAWITRTMRKMTGTREENEEEGRKEKSLTLNSGLPR